MPLPKAPFGLVAISGKVLGNGLSNFSEAGAPGSDRCLWSVAAGIQP